MESKRSDNRRRRVLYDEAVQQTPMSPTPGADASTAKRRRSNSYGARGNHQLKTCDLIPTRWLTMGLIASGSLLALGVVNLLHWFAANPVNILDDSTRAALLLTSPNGLATWLATVMFLLASLFSLQNFAMRRHRRDDYRGTYRVWLALAALFLLASIQCIVPLDRLGTLLLAQAIPSPTFARGEVGIVSIKLALVLAVFIRVLVEIRFCRSAFVLLVLSLVICSSAALLEMPAIAGALMVKSRWITDNLHLVGALTVLHCVIAYSRFVCLDVQGMLNRRSGGKRKRKSRSAKNRASRGQAVTATPSTPRTQPAPVTTSSSSSARPQSSPTAKPAAGPPPTSANPREAAKLGPLKSKIEALKSSSLADDSDDDDSWDDDDGETSGNGNQRLSKAERRRLKKLHRQQRNAA